MTKTRSSFRAILKDFSERTTAHGVSQIYGTESYIWRMLWLLVFLGCLGMVLYQGIILLLTYLDKPVSTRLDINYSQTTNFPAVTICNMNMLKKSAIRSFPSAKALFGMYESQANSNKSFNSSEFVGTDMKKAMKDRLSVKGQGNSGLDDISMDTQEYVEHKMLSMISVYDDKDLMEAGHPFDELIFRCVWNGFTCNKGDFLKYWRPSWNWRYGNCYTFNAGSNVNGSMIPILTSSKPGPMFGLKLDLFINQAEYISALSQEAGVKVLLSDQRQIPFPFIDGFTVPPGTSSSIGIRMFVINRVDPFNNGSCFSGDYLENESIYIKEMRGTRYSVQGCMNSCLANMQKSTCNCTEGKFRARRNAICMNQEQVECLSTVGKSYENGSLGCSKKCPQACEHLSFRRTISTAAWAQAYEHDFQRMVQKSARSFDSKMHSDKDTFRNNFLRVKLFFEELNLEEITYSESYPIENLLGDLGGQLGLWIGVSVITCGEFMKLFLDIIVCFYNKARWHSERKVDQDIGMS